MWDPLLAGWWPSQTTWDSLGGPASAPPVAVSPDPDSLDVFTLGASGKVLHKSWSTSTGQWSPSPSGWNDLGTMGSAPTAASWGAGHIDVIALDASKRAYNKVYNASAGWWPSQTGWQGLGGKQFAETPVVDSWGAGHLDIVGRGVDGRAYNKAWEASGWSPSQTEWYDMGGDLAGPPSVVSSDVGHLEVVARSTDGRLLYKRVERGQLVARADRVGDARRRRRRRPHHRELGPGRGSTSSSWVPTAPSGTVRGTFNPEWPRGRAPLVSGALGSRGARATPR